jgi:hypothetical protein
MGNSVRQAFPKSSSTNIYRPVPDLESEIMPKETGDSESPVIMTTELQKKAEMSPFSTMLFPSEGRP